MFRSLILGIFLCGIITSAQASIIYSLDKTIGSGTLTGYIETDGTIGSVSSSSLVDFYLTLQAPNINGGAVSTATLASGFFGGTTFQATATDLFFDFSSSDLWGVYTSSSDWWCVAGNNSGCFTTNAESIGYSDVGSNPAYYTSYNGLNSIASVTTSVPEPSALALMGLGLVGFVATRRKLQK